MNRSRPCCAGSTRIVNRPGSSTNRSGADSSTSSLVVVTAKPKTSPTRLSIASSAACMKCSNQVTGERSRYFYGVARKVQLEYLRRKIPQGPQQSATDSDQVELEYRCLEECMDKLSPENRKLVLRYYEADGREKIEKRKLLAEELGIAPNALRIRAYRIRAALQKCLEQCVENARDEIPSTFWSLEI